MKKKNVFWGSIFIISAALIILSSILSGLGFIPGIPMLNLVLGVLCLAWIISALSRRYFVLIYFPIAFIYMLFKDEISGLIGVPGEKMISNWVILLCALLLSVGTGILSSGTKYHFNDNGGESVGNSYKSRKSQSTRYIDSTDFVNQKVEASMSSCDVFFENSDNYYGGGTLTVENNMASLTVHVPKVWHVIVNIENNLGYVSIPSGGDPNGKVINIIGENNMGKIEIKLI